MPTTQTSTRLVRLASSAPLRSPSLHRCFRMDGRTARCTTHSDRIQGCHVAEYAEHKWSSPTLHIPKMLTIKDIWAKCKHLWKHPVRSMGSIKRTGRRQRNCEALSVSRSELWLGEDLVLQRLSAIYQLKLRGNIKANGLTSVKSKVVRIEIKCKFKECWRCQNLLYYCQRCLVYVYDYTVSGTI